jgi:TolB-like protein
VIHITSLSKQFLTSRFFVIFLKNNKFKNISRMERGLILLLVLGGALYAETPVNSDPSACPDTLFLQNGDQIIGSITDKTSDAVTLEAGGEQKQFSREFISKILYCSPLEKAGSESPDEKSGGGTEVIGGKTGAGKTNVAVNSFAPKGIPEATAQTITDVFRAQLGKTGKFNVMERAFMTEILQEQEFQQSEICDAASACAVEMGQFLGVDKIVVGNVGKAGKTWTVNVRLVNVGTGAIIKDEAATYKGSEKGLMDDIIPELAQKLAGTYKKKKGKFWIYGSAAAVLAGAAGAGAYFYLMQDTQEEKTGGVGVRW